MDYQKKDDFLKLSASPVSANNIRTPSTVQVLDEETPTDVDEPPDEPLNFCRQPIRSPTFPGAFSPTSKSHFDLKPRQPSLLTQGLLTIAAPNASLAGNELNGLRSARSTHSIGSVASTAELTSDGGLTSPARTSTPSPPLPPTNLSLLTLDEPNKPRGNPSPKHPLALVTPPEQPPAEQPRKRCIKFACPQPPRAKTEEPLKPAAPAQPKQEAPCTRRTTLKFACPIRPAREQAQKNEGLPKRLCKSPPPRPVTNNKPNPSKASQTPDQQGTPKKSQVNKTPTLSSPSVSKRKRTSPQIHDDAWTQEQPARERKLTVNDTLKKENAIRKLGEEAEAEALEEEKEEEENADVADEDDEEEALDDEDENEVGDYDADLFSDDGNETDDEEGFAASEDEDEDDSEYQFWTPGVTTAATSADHLEHIRSKQKRTVSESSIESAILSRPSGMTSQLPLPIHKPKRKEDKLKMRPSTPELPDSTDFVCGTLDEDRPLEVAYRSCMEQRKLSKHGITPQDLDPSFPTSDPEQPDSDEDDDIRSAVSDKQAKCIPKVPDVEDSRWRSRQIRRNTRSPSISPKRKLSPIPKRCKSPAPMIIKKGNTHRSPPPKRLFGTSPKRVHSPPPQKLFSPPSTRRPSYSEKNIAVPNLAQRPHLTHTKSLPRTPNPFWKEHRRLQLKASRQKHAIGGLSDKERHSRGPIDIVQGLERKRQRRKDKFWLAHCRHAAKEKDRRCQPGKGAERMREVGLEMADRCKGYGQRLQLVLSV